MENHKFGPLLAQAMRDMSMATTAEDATLTAAVWSAEEAEAQKLPVVIKMPTVPSRTNEGWMRYRARVEAELLPLLDDVAKLGVEAQPLFAGNALQANANVDQLRRLSEHRRVDKLELDPLVQVVSMDDSVVDLDLGAFVQKYNPNGRGKGVTVAVLDSGVDHEHPFLRVAGSANTSGESVGIPGSHGTHCAGSIASRDSVFPGIAPDVTLLNVKVLRANGTGRHTMITQGIDAALDARAQVLSMSVGFNHLPTWSAGGHGWLCTDGKCPLCTAVDNATLSDGAVCVVAAANEHERADTLRQGGHGATFDTELGCPGQAREAITVAAITKRTFLIAPFSSHGPTSYGANKPDLAAPGVNITSTIPVPRLHNGQLLANPARALLFGRKSGTSMATPMVAGAVALIIERYQAQNVAWTPAMVRNELLSNATTAVGLPALQVGAGRLHLDRL
jgi:serine protease AprX